MIIIYSQTKIVKCGIRQGSTSRPLLFPLYMDDITNPLEKCIVYQFAKT